MTGGSNLIRLCDRLPVASYGGGGFKFGAVRVTGSILILAGGVYRWEPPRLDAAAAPHLIGVIKGGEPADFFLFGSGTAQIFPEPEIMRLFDEAGAGIEAMATGPACRTYNLLLAEQRHFAAGLIAI